MMPVMARKNQWLGLNRICCNDSRPWIVLSSRASILLFLSLFMMVVVTSNNFVLSVEVLWVILLFKHDFTSTEIL